MVNKLSKAEKKIAYDAKLCQLLDEYSQILIAAADNVGSTQLQNIRRGLRGDSVVLMGKNTMMKRSVRIHSEKTGNKTFLNLIPLLQVYNNIDYLVPFLCLSWSFLFWLMLNLLFCLNRVMSGWFSLKVISRKWARRLRSIRFCKQIPLPFYCFTLLLIYVVVLYCTIEFPLFFLISLVSVTKKQCLVMLFFVVWNY